MSAEATQWAATKAGRLSSLERAVLWQLACWCKDGRRQVFCGLSSLATASGAPLNLVVLALHRLTISGLISLRGGIGAALEVTFLIKDMPEGSASAVERQEGCG